jgi:hypothetical protein
MFSAFLPFFKRSHTDPSSEPANSSVAQLRESMSGMMQSLAADSSAMQTLRAEMLSDMSSWTDADGQNGRPAKYEAFAARITRIGATPAAADEFTLVTPVESAPASGTPSKNSFAALAARLPESARDAIGEMAANKPSPLFTAPTGDEATTPPIEPPQTRSSLGWDIPPMR